MRDLMTPTFQLQYSETKNTWRNNLSWWKLNQPFDLKQFQPAKYLRSSTPGYQQKPVRRWRPGIFLLTAEFAGAINVNSNEHSVSGRCTYWVGYTSINENLTWVCSQQCLTSIAHRSLLGRLSNVGLQRRRKSLLPGSLLLQPWRCGALVSRRMRNPQQPLRTPVIPQENPQEVEEPYGRSYYLSWSLSSPTLSPQSPIKEKANFILSLKKSV